MADRRERILAQLLVVAKSVDGVKKAVRNQKGLSDDQMPGIVIYDSDEDADDRDVGRSRPPNAPNMVTMTPEILLLLAGLPENVGEEINSFRAKFLKAVMTDSDLRTIVGSNGEIRYRGCATGLTQGRQMSGEMGVSFAFTYPLLPAEL